MLPPTRPHTRLESVSSNFHSQEPDSHVLFHPFVSLTFIALPKDGYLVSQHSLKQYMKLDILGLYVFIEQIIDACGNSLRHKQP